MDQVCPQFLHVFSASLGVQLNKGFAEVFCVMYAGGAYSFFVKDFTEIKN